MPLLFLPLVQPRVGTRRINEEGGGASLFHPRVLSLASLEYDEAMARLELASLKVCLSLDRCLALMAEERDGWTLR